MAVRATGKWASALATVLVSVLASGSVWVSALRIRMERSRRNRTAQERGPARVLARAAERAEPGARAAGLGYRG